MKNTLNFERAVNGSDEHVMALFDAWNCGFFTLSEREACKLRLEIAKRFPKEYKREDHKSKFRILHGVFDKKQNYFVDSR